MIALRRGADTLKVKFVQWEASQAVAKQHGWRPIGAFDAGDCSLHLTYLPGRAVCARDASALADAIERLVKKRATETLAPSPRAAMNFHRGKIADVTVGPRWRVKHAADKTPPPTTGMVEIVGAADEREAVAKVQSAYSRQRIFISAERLD